jgi:hypothetical protein
VCVSLTFYLSVCFTLIRVAGAATVARLIAISFSSFFGMIPFPGMLPWVVEENSRRIGIRNLTSKQLSLTTCWVVHARPYRTGR